MSVILMADGTILDAVEMSAVRKLRFAHDVAHRKATVRKVELIGSVRQVGFNQNN